MRRLTQLGPLWESNTHLIDDVLQCWLWFLAGRRRAEYPVHGVDLKVTGRRPVPKVWTTVLYGIEILRWHYAHLSHLTAQQLQPIWIFLWLKCDTLLSARRA